MRLLQYPVCVLCSWRQSSILTRIGLHLIPSLLSEDVQTALLSRLLHRDLAEKSHRTNIYKHYNIPYHLCNAESNQARADEGSSVHMYSSSFFNCDPNSPITFEPIDPTMHKPLTIRQFLNKKLRWITLGGQYDWTEKSYPKDKPPEFPADEAAMIQTAFPEMRPEAAIVNIYSPGDTLSLHRDLSEEADQGLVSISMGCDGIFIVGLESTSPEGATSLAIRLRSGDAVYMSRSARWAWHGVPRIVPGSCPKWLRAWPVQGKPSAAGQDPDNQSSTAFEAWRGWMETKRINLNVRQMYP